MENNWIDKVLKEQYQFVRVLKRNEKPKFVYSDTKRSENRL